MKRGAQGIYDPEEGGKKKPPGMGFEHPLRIALSTSLANGLGRDPKEAAEK